MAPFGSLEPAVNGGGTGGFKSQTNHFPGRNGFSVPTRREDDYSSDEEDENEYRDLIMKGNRELEPSILDERDEATPDNWIERNSSMVRLTGKHPFNSEAPLNRLMSHGFITPVPLHYVSNRGAVPKANWETWTVEVSGLVKRPAKFTIAQLVNDFPCREFPVTLVCAGNRRKEMNMVKQTTGFNWGAAAVSTSLWGGVPLCHVLKKCGIFSRRKGALNVCFEGGEDSPDGGGSKDGTSIKTEYAMDPSRDIILAYMQNGEKLSPDHGFPIRVVIPGFIDGRMIKWLKRIIVTTKESDHEHHYRDNRLFPSYVDAEQADEEGLWFKPEYIINELNINSVITTPCHGEILPINSWTTQRPYTLRGYAYSGGGKKITRVEVTMNGGETWLLAGLEIPEKGNKYGKFWCWCFWSLEVEVLDVLAAKEIAVRAWDETLNTQPEKLNWNVMGLMNNCWFKLKTNVCRPHKGEIGIVFEHPTLPGNQSGGWMAREKHLVVSTETKPTLKKSVSTPFIKTAPNSKTYSMAEVKKHDNALSAWIIVHGHVYDCTPFLKDHPGGSDSILINAGTDCTEEFDAIHSDKAKKMLEDYRIGELISTGYTSDSSPNNSVHGASNMAFHLPPITEKAPAPIPVKAPAPIIKKSPVPIIEKIPAPIAVVGPAPVNGTAPAKPVALSSKGKIPCKLIAKTSLSHDSRLFRFALPSEDQLLGLAVGKHVYLCAVIGGKLCMRAYTPSSSVDEVGFFDLVVKIYFKDVHPKFPNGGLMSQYLDTLQIGSSIDIKGPLGHIEYTGRGNFIVHKKPKFAKKLAMISGGTGITPIYQVVQAILKDPKDETEMFIVYANRTEDDILLKDELDSWAKKHERLKIWYVIQESVKEGWPYSIGFITEEIMKAHIPDGSDGALALVCGPPPMIQFAVQPNLEKMNYDIKEAMLVF